MEVKPHEQIVIKVDGSRRLTLRNRRFIRELDPGKTSLRNHTPGPQRMRHYDKTLPLRSPPPTMMITPPQITPPEKADELPRNTETPTAEVSLPDQYQNEKGDQVRDVTVVENTPVHDPDARPIRQKISC